MTWGDAALRSTSGYSPRLIDRLMRLALFVGLLGVTTFSTAGCGCNLTLPIHISPGRDIALAPGESVRLEFSQGGGCGGGPATVSMHYLSSDTLIARVDSLSGDVKALRPGEAQIWLNYRDALLSATSYTDHVDVHVR